MSIQPSQVASIDLSGKPEGATHYSVNRPDASVANWYKLESGKWKFWSIGRWTSISGAAPSREVFEIPAQPDWSQKPEGATHYFTTGPAPWRDLSGLRWKWFDGGAWKESGGDSKDLLESRGSDLIACPAEVSPRKFPDWSKGPADATHWGPAASVQNSCIAYVEGFYKFSEDGSMVATDMFGWEWRKVTRDVTPERRAMLIERPQVIDWSAAPEWATGHGLIGDDLTPAWVGNINYRYVGEAGFTCSFSSDTDHPLHFHRSDVKGLVLRPVYGFASQVQEGIEDVEAGNLIALDDVKARWESRSAWNGEGRPPVGTTCGLRYKGVDQGEATVLFMSAETGVFANSKFGHEQCGDLVLYDFYLIRTPEQIAADERLHKIRNAATHIATVLSTIDEDHAYAAIAAIEAMIDAGYAKQVKV